LGPCALRVDVTGSDKVMRRPNLLRKQRVY